MARTDFSSQMFSVRHLENREPGHIGCGGLYTYWDSFDEACIHRRCNRCEFHQKINYGLYFVTQKRDLPEWEIVDQGSFVAVEVNSPGGQAESVEKISHKINKNIQNNNEPYRRIVKRGK